ncbi:MAG TPA: hypothetical protein VFF76_03200 [Holophagaceae bacterium]|jgi:hypothetical protein|nr:hypothetical protein [Holophagaceae bacterium]
MTKRMLMIASLLTAAPLFAHGPAVGTATARVRIISQSAWQQMNSFSAMSEVRLNGVVERVDGEMLSLRMAFGTVRVELGKAAGTQALRAGDALVVVASKIMTGGAQRFLAMEVSKQG